MDAVWDQNKSLFDDLLGRLMRGLKAEVKGRHEDGFVDWEIFASNSQLPPGFVYNAIESNLIEARRQQYGAHWHEGRSGGYIEIPINFGQDML